MSKRKILAGSTSVDVPLYIADTTSSIGGGLAGLVFGSSGLVAEYRRQGSSSYTAITLVTKTLGTWVSGGFIVDGSALAGDYELGLPNAALAAGASWVRVRLYGATNMLPVEIEIELDAVNYQSATGFVTSVPSVVGAVGSVTGNVGGISGVTLPSSVASPTNITAGTITTVSGNVTGSVGSIASFGTLVADVATAVWAAATRTITAISDSAGITTLLSRLSSGRATGLDNLDAPITTRLASSTYVAPDNTSAQTAAAAASSASTAVNAVKLKTDNLPSSPAAVGSAMTFDMTQTVPTSPTLGTVGESLSSARGGSVGKRVNNPPSSNPGTGTFVTYASNDTTIIKTQTYTTDAQGNITSIV